ncbi:MAG: thiazole synthase [Deltaproteobacteria bacterium]|nr:thiazole synthase [Deltaproteobacteria bacterium]
MADTLKIGKMEFTSRLMVGTGKYPTNEIMIKALEASGAEVVTVAVRRVNLDRRNESMLDHIDTRRYTLLPNTAGCYTAEDAIRTARLAREALDTAFVKLEVLGDEKTLFPDNEALLEAARVLVKEGFTVLPYTSDMNTGIAGAKDPVAMARAMNLAVEAGRLAYRAGRIPKKLYATASSPLEGMIE